jgi:hypothetical protein
MQRELNRITDGTAEYAPEAVAGYQPNETAEPRLKQAAYEPTRMTGQDVWAGRGAVASASVTAARGAQGRAR